MNWHRGCTAHHRTFKKRRYWISYAVCLPIIVWYANWLNSGTTLLCFSAKSGRPLLPEHFDKCFSSRDNCQHGSLHHDLSLSKTTCTVFPGTCETHRSHERSSRRKIFIKSSIVLSTLLPSNVVLAEESQVPTQLQRRLSEVDLEKLPSGGIVSGWGPSDLFYPDWMEGRWHVRAALVNYSVPLGRRFLGGGNLEVAEKTLGEQKKQLGRIVEYDLRYVRTKRNQVVEDRLFNLPSRLNAYSGRPIVKNISYTDIPNSNRDDNLKRGDGPDDPLLATTIYFKGAVQKVFVTAFESEEDNSGLAWRSSQTQRTLFAAPGTGYNPFAVDEEVLTELGKQKGGNITGRVRLLGYLNPNDALYFEAGNRAVTVADYIIKYIPKPEIMSEKAQVESGGTNGQ